MVTRRQFGAASMNLGASSLLVACGPTSSESEYEETVRKVWRHGQVDRNDGMALRRELVRYATLAPSSHNTQCWKFTIADTAIMIAPDLSRRCPAVDPDDYHLFVSLGCAAENLAQAALAHGLKAHANLVLESDALHIALEPTVPVATPLFHSIRYVKVREPSTTADPSRTTTCACSRPQPWATAYNFCC